MNSQKIWKESNSNRYVCKHCLFNTHNKALYNRHCDTVRHFVNTAPKDISRTICEFLIPKRNIYAIMQIF